MDKKVLITSIGFSPNVGGIETHFDDLVRELLNKKWKVCVLTYKPLTTNATAPYYKSIKNLTIYRLPIFKGLFYKLVTRPTLEFLYLCPLLFLALPILLLTTARDVKVIHSHGLVAGFVSVLWGNIFRKRVITTTHSIYNFPTQGWYRLIAKWIFGNSAVVLTLSQQSKREIERLGVSSKKIQVFTYWIDLKKFKRVRNAKQKLEWNKKFVVLFVGRLIKEKGIMEVISSQKNWPKGIFLAIAGTGPLDEQIQSIVAKTKQIIYLGKVSQDKLPLYYSGSDVLIVPSTHEEGFGRVILESLACGTPVIGSNRGAIPEAMDESVGKLIKVNQSNIKRAVKYFYSHKAELETYSYQAVQFAHTRYSEKNAETIINNYR